MTMRLDRPEDDDGTARALALHARARDHFEAGQFEEGLAQLQLASDVLHDSGQQVLIAAVCADIGFTHLARNDHGKAVVKLEESLEILIETRERSVIVAALLNNIVSVLRELGHRVDSLRYLQRALEINREVGEREGEAVTLANIGSVHGEHGNPTQALQLLEQALLIQQDLKDAHGEAATRTNLGWLYRESGQPSEALRHYEFAQATFRGAEDSVAEGRTLNGIGAVHLGSGRFDEALAHFHSALAMLRDADDRGGEAAALSNLGSAHHELGDFDRAIHYYEQALTIRRAADRAGEARLLGNLGDIHQSRGDISEALEHFESALSVLRDSGDRRNEAALLNNIGMVYRDAGRGDVAIPYLVAALEIEREVRNRAGEATTLNNIGLIYRSTDRDAAIRCHEAARAISEEIGDRPEQVQAHYDLAFLYWSTGAAGAADDQFRAAIELVETLRGEIDPVDVRSSFFATYADLYRSYAGFLSETGRSEDAFEHAQRGKSRAFLDVLSQTQSELARTLDPELFEAERGINRTRSRTYARVAWIAEEVARIEGEANERDDARLADYRRERGILEDRLSRLDADARNLETEIRTRHPDYAAVSQVTSLSVEEARRGLLDEQSALLEYVLGEEISLLFVITVHQFEVFRLPPRREVESLVRRLRAAVIARFRNLPFAHELYEQLIGPAEGLLNGKESVLVCADGALHYLPFSLLLRSNPSVLKESHRVDSKSDAPADPATLNEGHPPPARALMNADLRDVTRDDLYAAEQASDALEDLSHRWADLDYVAKRWRLTFAPSAHTAAYFRGKTTGAAAGSASSCESSNHLAYDAELLAVAYPADGVASGDLSPAIRAAVDQAREGFHPLPYTLDEVWAIAAAVCPGEIEDVAAASDRPRALHRTHLSLLTADLATKGNVSDAARRSYRFVHFATHGVLNNFRPELSGLLLARDPARPGSDAQGETSAAAWLEFHEIIRASFECEVATLSCCETALGRHLAGEGIVGLTRAFQQAGARSVCASLWSISDEATPRLMEAFYRRMAAGSPPAQALAEAQVEISYTGAHPWEWSAFALWG